MITLAGHLPVEHSIEPAMPLTKTRQHLQVRFSVCL